MAVGIVVYLCGIFSIQYCIEAAVTKAQSVYYSVPADDILIMFLYDYVFVCDQHY